jgi:putative two-component system response regulator
MARLARAGEMRDGETGRHTVRVGELAGRLAESAGMPRRIVEVIRHAAPLHDVGKIGIPDSILNKPGSLTVEEIAIMRTHTTIGAEILSGGHSEITLTAERIALGHHEWWNGEGYPAGASGNSIPIEARCVAIADCFDALSHPRSYRDAWPLERVLENIREGRGSHFDPSLVDVLLEGRCYLQRPKTPVRPINRLD